LNFLLIKDSCYPQKY